MDTPTTEAIMPCPWCGVEAHDGIGRHSDFGPKKSRHTGWGTGYNGCFNEMRLIEAWEAAEARLVEAKRLVRLMQENRKDRGDCRFCDGNDGPYRHTNDCPWFDLQAFFAPQEEPKP